jgi:hypothetical protein
LTALRSSPWSLSLSAPRSDHPPPGTIPNHQLPKTIPLFPKPFLVFHKTLPLASDSHFTDISRTYAHCTLHTNKLPTVANENTLCYFTCN